MRDLLLLFAVAVLIPLLLRAPIVGLLAWMWIALMNPQRMVYGFLGGFELNFYIAALTALAWGVSRERKVAPLNATTVLLFAFGLYACVTTYFALEPGPSQALLDRTLKTIVLAMAVVTLATSVSRLQAVIWTLAVSLGYYGVKGAGFIIATGGHQRVYGPDMTMIADNNSLGLALVALLPLLNYLRTSSRTPLARLVALATMACSMLAVIGTYSRGGLLALIAAAAFYAVRSRSGVVVLLAGAVLAVSLPSVLPSSWSERMATIKTFNEDASFEGRVAAWRTSVKLAKARPLIGGGFSAVERERYFPDGGLEGGRAAHSIYFQVLGDHGFVGLALYLGMLLAAWVNTSRVLIATRGRRELEWATQLARMLQVSMVAFLVGGAALSMAYYDGFLIIVVLTAALLKIVRDPVAETATQAASPRWKRIVGETAPESAG